MGLLLGLLAPAKLIELLLLCSYGGSLILLLLLLKLPFLLLCKECSSDCVMFSDLVLVPVAKAKEHIAVPPFEDAGDSAAAKLSGPKPRLKLSWPPMLFFK